MCAHPFLRALHPRNMAVYRHGLIMGAIRPRPKRSAPSSLKPPIRAVTNPYCAHA